MEQASVSGDPTEMQASSQPDVSDKPLSEHILLNTTHTHPLIEEDHSELPDAAQNLLGCDWETLQEHFSGAMEVHAQAEQVLREQTAQLLEVFMAWSHVSVSRDEDRAFKRFKTRMQHVRNSEKKLEDKKKHYENVVKAFESALALLNS